MNVRYSLGDYTLKVLGCDKSLDVLDFYYRNRNDFDIYESDKPEAFYTEEFIKNMLNAENKALMSLHFVRFFLVSNDNPDYIIGTISLSHINRGSSPSANMGYKIDRLNRGKGLASLMVKHMLEILTHEKEMHRIEAYIHPQNISSINLVKSLGFISEGTAYSYVKLNGSWQDHLRFVYIS